jgi:arsenical pump membrane protein
VTAAAIILAVVMLLVVWRPRGLPVALPAAAGALGCVLVGIARLADVTRVLSLTWNATVTLIGLMILSATLEANGAFRAAAHRIARASRGDGRRLYVGLALLTAGAATLLANDGAILILTPIVAELAAALAFERRQTIAYLFAVGFLCDALSTLLPTANLTNILLVDTLAIDPGAFFAHMLVPTLVLLVVATGTLALALRRDLPARCNVAALGPPPPFSRRSFRATFVTLGLLVAGYGAASLLRLPLGPVVLVAAIGLLAFEGAGDTPVDARHVLRGLPWSIVAFAFSLFLIVYVLGKAGAARDLAELLDPGGRGTLAALVIAAVVVALLSACVNNLPVLLVTLLALRHLATATVGLRPIGLPYAALLGANVGSKLTPIGSLATLLWLDMLARRGLRVGWGRYTRLALMPAAASLVAATVALALVEWM